ncbi:MAG: PHP domain-containing protein [Rhodothermales bacterium]|nr:PHP domain-containing protein [Rhodothermales bacterium]
MRHGQFVDMHTHSTCSDGALSPAALVRRVHGKGLVGFALTDHDTLRGFHEAAAAGAALGIEVIPGVELSVRITRRIVHLLGYFFDPDHAGLATFMQEFETLRIERAAAILDRLRRLGVVLTLEEVFDIAQGASVGRPHIARAMARNELVSSPEEAFTRYLKDAGPAYVPIDCPPARDALEALHAAGGIGVLAHPGHWTSDHEIRSLKSDGLDGLETIHPSHDTSLIDYYRRLACTLGLVETGGSDFHGYRSQDDERLGRLGVTGDELARARAACAPFVPAVC